MAGTPSKQATCPFCGQKFEIIRIKKGTAYGRDEFYGECSDCGYEIFIESEWTLDRFIDTFCSKEGVCT